MFILIFQGLQKVIECNMSKLKTTSPRQSGGVNSNRPQRRGTRATSQNAMISSQYSGLVPDFFQELRGHNILDQIAYNVFMRGVAYTSEGVYAKAKVDLANSLVLLEGTKVGANCIPQAEAILEQVQSALNGEDESRWPYLQITEKSEEFGGWVEQLWQKCRPMLSNLSEHIKDSLRRSIVEGERLISEIS